MTHNSDREERQSRYHLKAVLETSRMLIESKDSQFVFNNLLLIIMGKMLVGKAAILIQQSSDKRYDVVKTKGNFSVNEGDRVEISPDHSTKNKPFFTYKSDKDFPSLCSNMEGSIFFNLRTSDHHLGYLFIPQKLTGESFQEHELEFIESLCMISSAAISNSWLFDELKESNRELDQRVHELNTLFDLSKEFNHLIDRDKIANIFKFALLGQMFIRTFFLIFKSDNQLYLLTSSGLQKKLNQSQISSIFENTPVGISDQKNELLKSETALSENKIAALIGVDIQQDKTAVIGIGERANGNIYTETDFNFLRSLSNLAVVSIQKTYLLEQQIEKVRLEEELELAKSIQNGLLPDTIPEVDGVDLAAATLSSRQVGGDYFDIVRTPDGHIILAIADVTGKGFPASLLMANLQSMLHILLPVDISLCEATDRINNLIHKNTPSDKFITFFWAKYFSDRKIIKYVNAGHNPPLLLRKGSSDFEELTEGGLLLGALETLQPYQEMDIEMHSGDMVVCFTDGVNEAMNPEKTEEYEMERFKNVILKNRDLSSSELLDEIVKDVKQFSQSDQQTDDITLLIFKVL